MKIKVKVTITREIEFDPKEVYSDFTPAQILESEKSYADNLLHEWMDAEGVTFETTAEVIEPLPHDSTLKEIRK